MYRPNRLLLIAGAVGVGIRTIMSEKVLRTPKAIGLFYIQIFKASHASTGSKRTACREAAIACCIGFAPGADQQVRFLLLLLVLPPLEE